MVLKVLGQLKGFFCYARKNFPDAQNFPGSNATLLPRFLGHCIKTRDFNLQTRAPSTRNFNLQTLTPLFPG